MSDLNPANLQLGEVLYACGGWSSGQAPAADRVLVDIFFAAPDGLALGQATPALSRSYDQELFRAGKTNTDNHLRYTRPGNAAREKVVHSEKRSGFSYCRDYGRVANGWCRALTEAPKMQEFRHFP